MLTFLQPRINRRAHLKRPCDSDSDQPALNIKRPRREQEPVDAYEQETAPAPSPSTLHDRESRALDVRPVEGELEVQRWRTPVDEEAWLWGDSDDWDWGGILKVVDEVQVPSNPSDSQPPSSSQEDNVSHFTPIDKDAWLWSHFEGWDWDKIIRVLKQSSL